MASNIRSEILQAQNFSLDQLELLARSANQSVEMLQMMIDGVGLISDEDARLIEQLLEKPAGFLDRAPELAAIQIETPQYESSITERFAALPKSKQKLVSDLIDALSSSAE